MWCQIWQFKLGNTLKLSHKKKEKNQRIHNSVFQKYIVFLHSFDGVYHMLRVINQNFYQNKKKWSWDKTREGNFLFDLAISAQKYFKIVTQEKQKISACGSFFCLVSVFDIPTRTWGPLGLAGGPTPISFGTLLPSKII